MDDQIKIFEDSMKSWPIWWLSHIAKKKIQISDCDLGSIIRLFIAKNESVFANYAFDVMLKQSKD